VKHVLIQGSVCVVFLINVFKVLLFAPSRIYPNSCEVNQQFCIELLITLLQFQQLVKYFKVKYLHLLQLLRIAATQKMQTCFAGSTFPIHWNFQINFPKDGHRNSVIGTDPIVKMTKMKWSCRATIVPLYRK